MLSFKKNFFFVYLFMDVLGLCCRTGLSVVVASECYSLVGVCELSLWWLLMLQSTGSRAGGLQKLQHVDSIAVAPGL